MANPTRAEATEKRKKRSKTDSKPVLEKIVEGVKATAETANNVAQAVTNTAQTISTNLDAAKSRFEAIGQTVNQKSSPLLKSDSQATFKDASGYAQSFGIADIAVKELLGSDPYKADAPIPEMTAKEANEQKLVIQKQNNALSVRAAKIDQQRKVIQLTTENTRLIGDVVGLGTAQIETATKFVDNRIADTRYSVQQSKLEQTEQFLEQQRLATAGTISLTPHIREEWELKLKKAETKNQALKLEVEGAMRQNEINQEQLEFKLLEM
jgi:hypothetical protein